MAKKKKTNESLKVTKGRNKSVWANYEQFLRPVFLKFLCTKN